VNCTTIASLALKPPKFRVSMRVGLFQSITISRVLS
jgi:hypothetical protein